MKKAMISQAMRGVSDTDIKATRQTAIKVLTELGYEVFDTFFTNEYHNQEAMTELGVRQIPVAFLAMSLRAMSMCDAVYFCKGWEQARGCKIEHAVAEAYGLDIIYEE